MPDKTDQPEEIIVEKEEEVDVLDAPSPDEDGLVLARKVLPVQIPLVPLTRRPLFPNMTVPLVVDRPALRKVIAERAEGHHRFVGLVLARQQEREDAVPELYPVGVVVEILKVTHTTPDGAIQAIVQALARFEIATILETQPVIVARVRYIKETALPLSEEVKAYAISIINSLKELIQLNPLHKEELSIFMSHSNLHEPGRLTDFAAALTSSSPRELQEILETVDILERQKKALLLIKKEIEVSRLQVKIGKQIEEKLSKQQREFFLREQLKAIKKELGLEKEGKEAEAEKFEQRMKKLDLPDEARERIDEELEKLKLLEPASPEFAVTHTYLDWLTILPWGVFTKDNYNIKKAERILHRDHYGLDDVKERILEFLSVGIMKGNISGSILCFVGPPGVGKTSVGRSIAESIGRNFYRFSIGGIRDEAEIKGHRRTYIGALPGKFIQTMKVCKSANPVIMLDEIDKIGASYRGDPASALLEVLDPEQNRDFLDHYLDVRFDLSNVFFICTANQLDTIPRPLLDRMEVIKLPGYIMEEKLQIARKYLIPKQLHEHGIDRSRLLVTSRAIREIIDGYAREPGVRGVEKHIKKIMRKSVRRMVEGEGARITIDRKEVREILGRRRFHDDGFRKKPIPGVAMGLAWTSMGGDTLHIEATKVKTGRAAFKQTGQLGKVMVESSEIAYTYVRSLLNDNDQARQMFDNYAIHLHVPAGATPKDGPSAGITMATALYSLAVNKPVPTALAMTGELTLTGRIMPVGGIKEKTIAAKRAKIKTVVFPTENRKDVEELPEHVRKDLEPRYVESFPEVVALCFGTSA